MNNPLTPEQEMILAHIDTDFSNIKNLSVITQVISISTSTDWFWSYSDDGSVLRNGERRVNEAVATMKALAESHPDEPGIQRVSTFVPVQGGETLDEVVDFYWPWYRACVYVTRTRKNVPDLYVELSLNGKLDEYLNKVNLLTATVVDVANSIDDPVYNKTVLNNDRVDAMAQSLCLPPVRAFKHIWDCYPITTPAKLFKKVSYLADLAEEVYEYGSEATNNKHRAQTMHFTSKAGSGFYRFEHSYSNNSRNLVSVRVKLPEISFVVPVMSVLRELT